jgi:oxygen-independent coproporphyrinogen-3 oxidase
MREGLGLSVAKIETLLVGGGTPLVLGVDLVRGIQWILGIDRLRGISEWTVEAHPEDVDAGLIGAWTAAGVSRVNLGVQTLHDPGLEWLGREHSADVARSSLGLLGRSSIRSWGVDLLYGLPSEVDADPIRSLVEVIAAGAPHISLYELVAEPETPLGQMVSLGEVEMASADRCADQYLDLCGLLESEGYEAYEMTAFALPGHQSLHAQSILAARPWLGLGPGAHSQLGGTVTWNLRDWGGYSSAVEGGQLPEAGGRPLHSRRSSPEQFWFALRRSEGIPLGDLSSGALEVVDRWMRRGLARTDRSRASLTPEGWLLLDELAVELAQIEAQVEPTPPGLDMLDS